MQITVRVSSHAANSGSHQWSARWIDGNPRLVGSSVNVIAGTPRAAMRRTSAAASVGSQSGTMPSGMRRPPLSPHHSSIIQSLYAATHFNARSLSCASRNNWPANRGMNGKHSERSVRLMSMSAMRAAGS